MKNKNILFILFLFNLVSLNAQTEVETILRKIEKNNKELQSRSFLIESMKLEDKSDNNLSDPSISYSYQFGSPEELGKTGELTISQEFDFPTLYTSRNQLNKLKQVSYNNQYELIRRDILLRAKELSIDLIYLNQQDHLLKKRSENIDQLTRLYQQRLEIGDATILEVNKVNLEKLKVQSAVLENEVNRQNLLQELIALNGDIPIDIQFYVYNPVERISEWEMLWEEYRMSDIELRVMESELEVAKKQVNLNKSGWLPKIEVGYRRNTGLGEQFNGFIVGGSIPLFENKNKVKAAKAQTSYMELQKEDKQIQIFNSFAALYNEYKQLKELLSSYDLALMDSTEVFLRKALEAKHISITEYFTELGTIYDSRENYIQLDNQYQKVVAQLTKNSL